MTPEAGGRLAARERTTPLVEGCRPQGKVEWHAGIELVVALDAPVLQMVSQLVDVLQFFDTVLLEKQAGSRSAQDSARGQHPAAHCAQGAATGGTVGGSADRACLRRADR